VFKSLPNYDPFINADDFYYDKEAGNMAVSFIENELKFTKGKWKGQPFILLPWQKDTIKCIFGWKHKITKLRRYRKVFLYVPRKNGKSQLVAAIADTILFCDGENDAEIYIGARDRGQALTLYKMSEGMLRLNNDLWSDVTPSETYKEIKAKWDNSKIQAISSDALSMHSTSPSVGIVDEVHAQRNGDLIEAIESGMGAREQPLMIYVTTADIDRKSICNDELEYAKNVRDGKVIDPHTLPIIYETKDNEEWDNPKVWAKSNPTYPITPNHDFLLSEVTKARVSKRKELSFKRLYLNMKTSSVDGWLNMDYWRMCVEDFEESEMVGKKCYGGIDLSSKTDLATIQLFFPESGRIISRFYLPESAIEKDKAGHYQEWIDEGYLTICGKEFIDYDYIMADLVEFYRIYQVVDTGIDTWNASYFITRVEKLHKIELTAYTQGIKSFNEPSKELETMVISKRIKHNSPVLSWNAINVSIKEDESGNIRPVKPKRNSPLKIDGIVALIMAIGLWTVDKQEEPDESVYLKRDMIIL
jgi:phage terminase large subunit-like protein